MRTTIFFGAISILFLSSCTLGQPKTDMPVGAPVPVVNYPTSQMDTPATKYCVSRGGTVSVEKDGTGGVDIAYCNLPEGGKVDAWKFMSESTQLMGTGS